MVLQIIFWLLWLLWLIGAFFPLAGPYQRGHGIILLILIGILGFRLFGSPLDK